MSNSYAIEVVDLRKSYSSGLFRRPFAAIQGVTLRIERGEVFGLLGPNGAGKTTLIKILLGIVRKSSGTAMLLGGIAGDRRSRLRVGYLPENLRISSHHSAVTAMNYYGSLSRLPHSRIVERRDRLLDLVGLTGRTRESVRRFSKGMLQRLGLAQALLHDPELLILDEPTDGLDPLGRSQIRQLLRQLKAEGKTVFLNSHILQEVELICDRVAIMDRGVLKGVGTTEEIAPKQYAGIELEIVVSGTVEAIQAGISDRTILQREEISNNQIRLRMRLANQDQVDECIDNLRREGVSLVAVVPHRITLEDAFLNLMNEASTSNSLPVPSASLSS